MRSEETEKYIKHLQKIINNILESEVTKEEAWEIFKDLIFGTVQFVLNQEENMLGLQGVGKFMIYKGKPQGKKKERGWEFDPRFKFYPSKTIDKMVEDHFNLGNHNLENINYGIFEEVEEDVDLEKIFAEDLGEEFDVEDEEIAGVDFGEKEDKGIMEEGDNEIISGIVDLEFD